MQCQFLGVYNGCQPLVIYPTTSGIDSIYQVVYSKDPPDSPISFKRSDTFTCCILHENSNLNFVCQVSDPQSQFNNLITNDLRQIRDSFLRQFAGEWKTGTEGDFDAFVPTLKTIFSRLNDSRIQKLGIVTDNLNATLETSRHNLEAAYLRNNNLESLQTSTKEVDENAQLFSRQATSVRRAICCQKYGFWFFLAFAVALVILVILLAACGITFSKCVGDGTPNPTSNSSTDN